MTITLLISVHQVAGMLGCSDRRVRYLLAQRRIGGFKDASTWKVIWPLDIRPGSRGPDLRKMPTRHFLKPVKPVSSPRRGSGTKGVLKLVSGASDEI